MGFSDYIPESTLRELRELRRAPWSVAVLVVVCIASGITVGGWYYRNLYSERISILEARITRLVADQERASADTLVGDGIARWSGGDVDECRIDVAGSELLEFRSTHNVVLVCGIAQRNVDRLADPNISVSSAFGIDSLTFTILAPSLAEKLTSLVASAFAGAGNATGVEATYTIWYELVLLPKSVAVDTIQSLQDVERLGGTRHSRRGVEIRRTFKRQ